MSGNYGWVLPVVLVGGGIAALYFLFKKGIPSLLESGANASNNTSVDQQQQAAAAKLPVAGQTISDAQITGIADSIFNGDNDYSNISRALAGLTNQADFNRLYQIFGTKQGAASSLSTCSLLGFNCQSYDLYAWVRASLSSSEINDLNALLSANGITSTF